MNYAVPDSLHVGYSSNSCHSRCVALIITLLSSVRISADQLEFQPGTSRVKYKDFHFIKTWWLSSNTTINLIPDLPRRGPHQAQEFST